MGCNSDPPQTTETLSPGVVQQNTATAPAPRLKPSVPLQHSEAIEHKAHAVTSKDFKKLAVEPPGVAVQHAQVAPAAKPGSDAGAK